ncbi:MAG: TRAP transporter large permease subunit [Oceanococcaceae bacterium]
MMALLMFVLACAVLLLGFPVALTLAGVALWFGLAGVAFGAFDSATLLDFSSRLWGIFGNETLVAVPLFILMGVVLERARLAEDLLTALSGLARGRRGALGITVVLVGAILAASTGIVGATVVTLGVLCLPAMLREGYAPTLASGTVAAAGTLGQIIPPSIVLVLLGDVLSSAYQQAQLRQGQFSTQTVSVGDLFAGALLPGVLLVVAYVLWVWLASPPQTTEAEAELIKQPASPSAAPEGPLAHVEAPPLGLALLSPLLLVLMVLGSILGGVATPTEAASLGAVGSLLIAITRRRLTWPLLRDAAHSATNMTAMVFLILIGASLFSLVFNAYGGDHLVQQMLTDLPGGLTTALVAVMLLVFLLGFVLDFIEITFVVVPIVGPALLMLGADPIWLGVLLGLNLQTSFLTPPFGFAMFYLRGVEPAQVATVQIWRGAVPFIVIQLLMIALVATVPALATALPEWLYGA